MTGAGDGQVRIVVPDDAPSDDVTDVAIIGAGPTGLFAAFYAGLRQMSVKLIDSLEMRSPPRDREEETGEDVDLPLHAFPDPETNLRAQVDRIRAHPWIKDVPVTGVVYEVETGRLRKVA